MCGIVGFVGLGDQQILKKMADNIIHRGPDDEGFFYEKNIGMGFRRLSIIDLSTGNQPIFNEDKNIVVIFNGEIYNFLEIRKDLLAKGHKFSTKTDTEVIAHLYEEIGDRCFEKFNGMFAIAVWDRRKEKLILARDRMGKKPLYYFFDNGNFIFGSELKALKAHPAFGGVLDIDSFNKYLMYEYVPTPRTIFKDTRKLVPGSSLTFQNGQVEIKKFWDISFNNCDSPSTEKEILRDLEYLINDAVKIRLVSDVPLGIFLSGGIDSSAIAYYAQKNSTIPIKTFSIGFEDNSFDESKYAERVASFLKTDHYSDVLSPKKMLELVPCISDILDEPMADASILPTYLLSKFTKQRVTVALGGDGGDELFAGYPTFLSHKLASIYLKIPKILRVSIFERIARNLPVSLNNFSFDFKIKSFIKGIEEKPEYRNQIWLGSFDDNEKTLLLKEDILAGLKNKNVFDDVDNELSGFNGQPLMNRILKLYQRQYMMDQVLVKVDRASMAASLEVRAPFLDYRVVDFINSINYNLKTKHFRAKYLLKESMKNKLPKEIVYRAKKGFGIPLAKWLKEDLKSFSFDLLNKDKIKREGFFNPDYVEFLLKEHNEGKKDNHKPIWTLMVFEMWMEKWLSK